VVRQCERRRCGHARLKAGNAHGGARRSGCGNAVRPGRERDNVQREREREERETECRERENGKRESKVMI
jgi:hypothetical protein